MLAVESTDRIALLRGQIARLERGERREADRQDGRWARTAGGVSPEAALRGEGLAGTEALPVAGRGSVVPAVFRDGRARNVWAGPETAAVAFGHRDADAATHGLARGALHDVTPAGAPDMAAATGFALGIAGRLLAAAGRRGLWLWVRADMAGREAGEPYGPGLAAFGLDPGRLVMVTAGDTVDVLRAAEEGLAARAFAAVLIEPFGDDRRLDLTACRRLSLIADGSRATGILLRTGGLSGPTSAVTRWSVMAAPGRSHGRHPGNPLFSAELLRNRLGATGAWMMEWRSDEQSFRAPEPTGKAGRDRAVAAALSGRLAAASADRSAEAPRAAASILAFPGGGR